MRNSQKRPRAKKTRRTPSDGPDASVLDAERRRPDAKRRVSDASAKTPKQKKSSQKKRPPRLRHEFLVSGIVLRELGGPNIAPFLWHSKQFASSAIPDRFCHLGVCPNVSPGVLRKELGQWHRSRRGYLSCTPIEYHKVYLLTPSNIWPVLVRARDDRLLDLQEFLDILPGVEPSSAPIRTPQNHPRSWVLFNAFPPVKRALPALFMYRLVVWNSGQSSARFM